MTKNKKATLGELELRDLVDLGLRMPDGSTELFEVVNVNDGLVALMTKNIIDYMPFNDENNKHPGKANSYAESSIRSYLVELYQSVVKENKLLETHTFGHKEFFLPTANALGFGDEAGKGWEAFKDDASRVKYPGTYAATKDEAYGPGESDWYWTSTPHASNADYVRYVSIVGALYYNNACTGSLGAAPALNLKSSAPVIIIEGVWHLYDNSPETLGDKSRIIKIGDWVEVTHAVEADIQKDVLLGDCFEVVSFGAQGEIEITLSSGKTWFLVHDQVRKIEPPLPYCKKTKESADFNERLKGYYQHTAIEALKVYHTAHKAKEERTRALNKVIENIQELIKLENE